MKKIITIILVICFGTKILAQSTYNYHICQGDSITLSEDSSVTIPGLIIPGFSDDNVRGPFSIGFPFCFYGSTYNQFYVGSNGWVGFSGAQTSTGITTAIPSIAIVAVDAEVAALANTMFDTTVIVVVVGTVYRVVLEVGAARLEST